MRWNGCLKLTILAEVEKSEYCRAILALRMKEGLLHKAPIWPDASTVDASDNKAMGAGGGFPCQAG